MKKLLLTLAMLTGLLGGYFSLLATPISASDNLGIGTIETPPGVDKYQSASGADIGIIYFASNLLKIFTVVMGIWVLFNIVLAGYIYLTGSGDAKAHQQVQTQVTNSIIGLILIVLSFTFAGLIGYIFFGDAAFILNPRLPTP